MALTKLNERQELFCAYVATGMSHVDAYIEAGYSKGRSRKTTVRKAHELRHEEKVSKRIDELTKKSVTSIMQKKEKEMEKIIERLLELSKIKISDVVDVSEDRVVSIKNKDLPGVKNIRFDRFGALTGIEMQDIQSSLDKLIRIFGGYKDTVAVELSGSVECILKQMQGDEF